MADRDQTLEAKALDNAFYDRADAFIHLANTQADSIEIGKVSAAFMYGLTRYNAFLAAQGYSDGKVLRNATPDILAYFVKQYEAMLRENLDDYARILERNIASTVQGE